MKVIEVVNNDVIESVDLENILQTLNNWQSRLTNTNRDRLINYVLEEVAETIFENTNVWEYK